MNPGEAQRRKRGVSAKELFFGTDSDAFDRMLVCQAKRLGLGIISVDKIIDSYQVRRVW